MDNAWRVGPTHVDFNVTNGCNLACTHCHSSSGDKLPRELSTAEVFDVLDQLHRLGSLRLAIAGGEPFMRRDIYDILEYACGLPGWQVAVITNGLFFANPGRVTQLAGRCPGLTVNVSLDGSTPTRFNLLRKQARHPGQDPTPMFNQVTTAIKTLAGAGIRTAVNLTLSRPTIEDCEPTYRLAVEELGASALVGIKFFPGGYGKAFQDLLELPFPVWSRAFAALTRAKLDGRLERLQISVPAAWEFYLPLAQAGIDVVSAEAAWGYRAPLRASGYRHTTTIGDTAGIAEMSIAGDGTVYPSVLCVGVEGLRAGDVRTESLGAIWAGSPVFTALRRQGVADLAAECDTCPLTSVCGGGSRARAYAGSSGITAADYACPLVRPASPRRPQAADRATAAPLGPANQTMRVLGAGPNAVRIFFTDQGCQVRANNHIIRFAPDESAGLAAALGVPDHADSPPASSVGTMLEALTSTLDRVGAAESAVAQLRSVRREVASGATR